MWTWRAAAPLITEPDLIADEYRAIVAGYLEETRRICTDINADYRLVRTGDALEDADRVPDGAAEEESGQISARLSHGTVDCAAERVQDFPRAFRAAVSGSFHFFLLLPSWTHPLK